MYNIVYGLTVYGNFYRMERKMMHEKHRGHDAMHAEMMLVLIVTLFVAQIILVQWRQRHFRSYQVTILCLSVSSVSVSMSHQYFSSGLYYFCVTSHAY